MANVTMIKKDALINLQIGTGFLQKLQQVLVSLTEGRTEEELQNFKDLAESKAPEFPEIWMENIITVATIINEIEQSAIKQGQTYDQEMTEDTTQSGS